MVEGLITRLASSRLKGDMRTRPLYCRRECYKICQYLECRQIVVDVTLYELIRQLIGKQHCLSNGYKPQDFSFFHRGGKITTSIIPRLMEASTSRTSHLAFIGAYQ